MPLPISPPCIQPRWAWWWQDSPGEDREQWNQLSCCAWRAAVCCPSFCYKALSQEQKCRQLCLAFLLPVLDCPPKSASSLCLAQLRSPVHTDIPTQTPHATPTLPLVLRLVDNPGSNLKKLSPHHLQLHQSPDRGVFLGSPSLLLLRRAAGTCCLCRRAPRHLAETLPRHAHTQFASINFLSSLPTQLYQGFLHKKKMPLTLLTSELSCLPGGRGLGLSPERRVCSCPCARRGETYGGDSQ